MSPGTEADASAFTAPTLDLEAGIIASGSGLLVSDTMVVGASTSGVEVDDVSTVSITSSVIRGSAKGIGLSYDAAVGASVTVGSNEIVGSGVGVSTMTVGIELAGHPSGGAFAITGNDISAFGTAGVQHTTDTTQASPSVYTISSNVIHNFEGAALDVVGNAGGANSEYLIGLNDVDGGTLSFGGLTAATGLQVTAGGLDDLEVTASDNTFDDLDAALDMTLLTTGTVTTLVSGNTIGGATAVGASADAMVFGNAGSSTLNATLDGNTVSAGSGDIAFTSVGGATSVNVALSSNEAPGYDLDATSAGTFQLEAVDLAGTVTAAVTATGNTTSAGAPSVTEAGTITLVAVGTVAQPADD